MLCFSHLDFARLLLRCQVYAPFLTLRAVREKQRRLLYRMTGWHVVRNDRVSRTLCPLQPFTRYVTRDEDVMTQRGDDVRARCGSSRLCSNGWGCLAAVLPHVSSLAIRQKPCFLKETHFEAQEERELIQSSTRIARCSCLIHVHIALRASSDCCERARPQSIGSCCLRW